MKLISIGDGHTLIENAGQSILRAFRDGAPRQYVNYSTRSYSLQYDWYVNRGKAGYPVYVEHPSTSKHVYRPGQIDEGARALDVNDPLRAWLVAWGREYGWVRTLSHEPWHFEYFVNLDVNRFSTPPTPITPIGEALGIEDDMIELVKQLYLTGLGRSGGPDEWFHWVRVASANKWTAGQFIDSFYNNRAERGTVTQAYWDYLKRAPESEAVVTNRLVSKPTIKQVRDSIRLSPEAQKK